MIVQLCADGTVDLANRSDNVRGAVKRSEIRNVLDTAGEHFEELVAEWEKMHA